MLYFHTASNQIRTLIGGVLMHVCSSIVNLSNDFLGFNSYNVWNSCRSNTNRSYNDGIVIWISTLSLIQIRITIHYLTFSICLCHSLPLSMKTTQKLWRLTRMMNMNLRVICRCSSLSISFNIVSCEPSDGHYSICQTGVLSYSFIIK